MVESISEHRSRYRRVMAAIPIVRSTLALSPAYVNNARLALSHRTVPFFIEQITAATRSTDNSSKP